MIEKKEKKSKAKKFNKWEATTITATAAVLTGLAFIGGSNMAFAGYQ